jgi:hypothetical protein
MANKDVKKLIRDLKRAGHRVDEDRRHYVVFGSKGGMVTISKTPSRGNWKKKVDGDLRRKRIQWKKK